MTVIAFHFTIFQFEIVATKLWVLDPNSIWSFRNSVGRVLIGHIWPICAHLLTTNCISSFIAFGYFSIFVFLSNFWSRGLIILKSTQQPLALLNPFARFAKIRTKNSLKMLPSIIDPGMNIIVVMKASLVQYAILLRRNLYGNQMSWHPTCGGSATCAAVGWMFANEKKDGAQSK